MINALISRFISMGSGTFLPLKQSAERGKLQKYAKLSSAIPEKYAKPS